MQLTIAGATDLAVRALAGAGMSAENARITADHLVDAALCSHEFASLPRVIALAEALHGKPPPAEMRVVRENHCSALLDIGTSQTTWGDVVLARTRGQPLPEGVAVNPSGHPTTDPDAALEGAILPWGGPRGSGLALAVQLLGILAGSDLVIEDISNYGLFFVVIDPKLFMPSDQFPARVQQFSI